MGNQRTAACPCHHFLRPTVTLSHYVLFTPHPAPRDATSTWVVNAATYGLFVVRRANVWLVHPQLGKVGRILGLPLRLLASALQRPLNKVLVLGVEVAMEYLLGLTSSPYVQWLQVGGGQAGAREGAPGAGAGGGRWQK